MQESATQGGLLEGTFRKTRLMKGHVHAIQQELSICGQQDLALSMIDSARGNVKSDIRELEKEEGRDHAESAHVQALELACCGFESCPPSPTPLPEFAQVGIAKEGSVARWRRRISEVPVAQVQRVAINGARACGEGRPPRQSTVRWCFSN